MNGPTRRLALIVGAMKCGTTSFFQYLGSHPDVLPSRTKQLNFFSDDVRWSRGVEWYRAQWPATEGDPWLLEASPSYTYPETARTAADRIAAMKGEVRAIYLIRDPIERIESHYFHGYHRGEFDETSTIGEALRRHPRLLEVTRYGRWIEAYRRRLGGDRLLVLHTRDLDRDPAATLARACRFLEVDDGFAFPDLATRYNRQAMQSADHPAVDRLRGLGWVRSAVRASVPLRVRERIKLFLKPDHASGPAGDERFRLSDDDRARVLDELRDDLAGLGSPELET